MWSCRPVFLWLPDIFVASHRLLCLLPVIFIGIAGGHIVIGHVFEAPFEHDMFLDALGPQAPRVVVDKESSASGHQHSAAGTWL